MNAQKRWKHYYRQIVNGMILPEYVGEQRDDMRLYRREAALERRCEAQQRTIQAQAAKISVLESDINALMTPTDYPYEGDEMNGLQREAAGA